MGFFFFDESIHSAAGFSLGTFVYSENDLNAPVAEALIRGGLLPRSDEFKSSSRMDRCQAQARVRDELKSVIQKHCRLGVVVTPANPRRSLGYEAVNGLEKIVSCNTFDTAKHEVFFDQGIFDHAASGQRTFKREPWNESCTFHFEQDSIQVLGLQVADLAAHICAIMLLSALGKHTKKVKAGDNSGYDPDMDIELDFELWACVRYNFFAAAPPPVAAWKSELDYAVDVASRGLHIAHACSPELRRAAQSRFGNMYLGCIH
ncbi:MAG TPA: hypothetical protein VGK01_04000 [Candidatus Angelobacter sp.]|jgi:hypothetical protein